MKKQTQAKLFKVFEFLIFVFITILGITVLTFGFRLLYEGWKQILK